jgi:PAS domain S-box-containing protein
LSGSDPGEPPDPSSEDPVEYALSGGVPQLVGWFRFYFDDERWEWSHEVHRMHGYEPGTVDVTTDVVLSHKHPDDHGQVAATIDEIRRTREPFSTRHRIIDVHGKVKYVIVVGDQLIDDHGAVIGTHGFYVDVTKTYQQGVNEAVEQIAKSRSVIDQAKGMLMVVYGLDESAAFELLKWRSQEANVRLRVIAASLVASFVQISQREGFPLMPAYDSALLSAHVISPQDQARG